MCIRDRLSYALFPKVALKYFENRKKGIAPAQPAAPAAQPAATAAPAPTEGSATYTVNVNGQAFSVQVSAGGAPQQVLSAPTAPAPAASVPAAPPANGASVTSPLPGSVFALKVAVGDQVSEGDVVIILSLIHI